MIEQPPRSPLADPLASLTASPKRRRGSPLPIIIVLLLVAVGGYFGWKLYERQTRPSAPRRRAPLPREQTVKKPVKEKQTNAVEVVQTVEKPKVPEKTPEEILAEEKAARQAVLAEIAEARKNPDAKPLTRFGGVLFGEPLAGEPVRWGTVFDEDEAATASLDARGATYAVWGPRLKKPILTFGQQPLVWVSPKTHRAYRVEFSRPLKLRPGAKHDPETTNTVAFLKRQPIFKDCRVFSLVPQRPDRPGCEFVLPLGSSTITVGEYGNELRFSVEQGDVKQEAKTEADAARQERRANLDDGKALDSSRYPHGDFGHYPRMKFKDATPKSFCGVVFGKVAAASSTPVNPRNGEKGFYLDYRRGKCPVFRGFDFGKADTDRYRGGVFAVRLYSPGGAEGLDDGDYYANVRETLAQHYKVKPTEKPVEGSSFAELSYAVGDVTIKFGPEPNGGFYLTARHEVLAALAKQDPAAKKKSSGTKSH